MVHRVKSVGHKFTPHPYKNKYIHITQNQSSNCTKGLTRQMPRTWMLAQLPRSSSKLPINFFKLHRRNQSMLGQEYQQQAEGLKLPVLTTSSGFHNFIVVSRCKQVQVFQFKGRIHKPGGCPTSQKDLNLSITNHSITAHPLPATCE